MHMDNRRQRQPQDPETSPVPLRVQPPGPSMEEWRATIEREIAGRMPFPNKAAEAHYTDRRWDGLAVYADYAGRAASELRAQYLSDQDLVVVRGHVIPLERIRDGLRVRVRPGTTRIPEHLYGCPITVEYVDRPSLADVVAAASEVTAAVKRLRSQQPGAIWAWSLGHVSLEA